jgi:hypothetical protein
MIYMYNLDPFWSTYFGSAGGKFYPEICVTQRYHNNFSQAFELIDNSDHKGNHDDKS